ncbi:response regulator [Marimonas sp. MJW-29]|uniref:Response regulator n=1 Tax=Sulfitobacter sediminis TaxID=3234186 RepID=A0ABV3RII5_9RHOB
MRQARILIVDDSQIDRMILRRAFDKADLNTVDLEEAEDAVSAIATLDRSDFDAIFLDVNMPGENGFHVLRSLREKRARTWPLVFMYSSSDHPDDIELAYREKATAYLCKPSEFSQVKDMMTDCVSLISRAAGGGGGQRYQA